MATYKLEDDPKVFITPHYYEDKFVYRMVTIESESDKEVVRQIDLNNDKLMVYGTKIEEHMLQKLHDSLILRPKNGIVYVNCEGACYFLISGGKGTFRPVHNVIYDWSSLGVVVPNSLSDSLKKQLVEREEEVNRLKSSISSSQAGSVKEVEELKRRVDSANSELQAVKGLLELSEKREMESKNEIVELKKGREEMEIKVRDVQDRASSIESELESTRRELDSSNKSVKELEIQLSDSRKELQRAQDELSQLVQSKSKSIIQRFLELFRRS